MVASRRDAEAPRGGGEKRPASIRQPTFPVQPAAGDAAVPDIPLHARVAVELNGAGRLDTSADRRRVLARRDIPELRERKRGYDHMEIDPVGKRSRKT